MVGGICPTRKEEEKSKEKIKLPLNGNAARHAEKDRR
jgi:hypothetical protein